MTTLEPQTVPRGDTIPPYRARKPPEAMVVRLCGMDADGILVVRCHDVNVAAHAVGDAVEAGTIHPDLAFDLVVHAVGALLWVRWVPDDPSTWPPKPTDRGSWERELRGTVGATPAVLFTDEEIPA